MPTIKGIEFSRDLAALVRHMRHVDDYREALVRLQTAWDTLSLLGELSGSAAEISGTREAFEELTGDLLTKLAGEIRRKAVASLRAKAQNGIDILVRNLFERTADIGFLAADTEITAFLSDPGRDERSRAALEARFGEYVRKYSVYSDVVLFDPCGAVVARLDPCEVCATSHPFLSRALAGEGGFVEIHARIDVLPGPARLVYAHKVVDRGGNPIGVLALVFRLEDELDGIFAHLLRAGDWTVLGLVGEDGTVVGGSCPVQLPAGLKLPADCRTANGAVVRIGGREYLAVARPATSYQGYAGPGWTGLALLGLDVAFDEDGEAAGSALGEDVLDAVMHEPRLFAPALRAIPERAARIQRDLSRSVWNGSVRQSAAEGGNAGFAKTLLWEIASTGRRTQAVFDDSIGNLRRTVVDAAIEDVAARAAFAIDVMDRNLYERANDCRWWALDGHLRAALEAPSAEAAATACETLAAINALYTVYTTLVLFDARGTIVATSRPERAAWIGTRIDAEWLARTLALRTSQGYAVSAFAPSPLYDDVPTYVYAAAVTRRDDGRIAGGIGIVFDSTPQFDAMLTDALPRDETGRPIEGAFALFTAADGRVIASSDARFPIGERADLGIDAGAAGDATRRSAVVRIGERHYALGTARSQGYREYKTSDGYVCDVTAVCGVPLGAVRAARAGARDVEAAVSNRRARAGGRGVEIATFHLGGHWLGLPASDVVEAIDADGLMPSIEAGGGLLAGYRLHRGTPLAVLALGARAGGPAATEGQIVVVRAPGGKAFGILVDTLGPIPEVEAEEIEPMGPLMAGWHIPARGLVERPTADGGTGILIVLDAGRIAAAGAVREAAAA